MKRAVPAAALMALIACAGNARRSEAPARPVSAVEHGDYELLLREYVGLNGKVDYPRWQKSARDVSTLDRYLAQLEGMSPDSRADLFPTTEAELSYWINLYNARSMREVLRRWPLESARAVRKDLGDIESRIARARPDDARAHFAISSGSQSCPMPRRTVFDAFNLDEQLDTATREFINDGANVAIDDEARRIRLSERFQWHERDFVRAARLQTGDETARISDFVAMHAGKRLESRLRRALSSGYSVEYTGYDWSPNVQDGRALGVGKPIPDIEVRLLDGSAWRPSQARGKVILIDYWATYCKPCRKGFPEIQALASEYGDEGLVVIAISQDTDPRLVAEFVAEMGVSFPVAWDEAQESKTAPMRVSSVPTKLIVDRAGVVRHRYDGMGQDSIGQLEPEIVALLAGE
jgi:thiol-disulfide isomerase/thioredoxin